jgi:hypothetical protein
LPWTPPLVGVAERDQEKEIVPKSITVERDYRLGVVVSDRRRRWPATVGLCDLNCVS